MTELVAAIQAGDVESVVRLLAESPERASSPLGGAAGARTALHVVADWPGYFPNGPEIAQLLVEAGADPNARGPGERAETPLHWAASSDDVVVARVLIDAGADLEAPDGSIGTPLDNAIGYGCWHVAGLLVRRGAKVHKLWHAAALGDLTRLRELLAAGPAPEDVSQAFWHACAGGQRRAAELLLEHGADVNWVPDYADGTPLDAAGALDTRREHVVAWLRDLGARTSAEVPRTGP
jgi:ankyrin repeat protein